MVKGVLHQQGYEIDVFDDPVYLMPPRGDAYRPLNEEVPAGIRAGTAGF